MAVPGHDERDREFAHTYKLPIVQSIHTASLFDAGEWKSEYGEDGVCIALKIPSSEARLVLIDRAQKGGF